MEHLFYKERRTEKLSDGRELFNIIFKERGGKEYIWAPKWEDFSVCFAVAHITETANAGVVSKNPLEKLEEDIKPFFNVVDLIRENKPSHFFPKELQEKLQKLISQRVKRVPEESKEE